MTEWCRQVGPGIKHFWKCNLSIALSCLVRISLKLAALSPYALIVTGFEQA